MKLITIAIFMITLNSCGAKKLPSEITQQLAPEDQDFDSLTIQEEKRLGSNPMIPDYPLLVATISWGIDLNFVKQDKAYSISSNQKMSRPYQDFLFETREKLQATQARITAEINLKQISQYINLNIIKNLNINLYIERNKKRVYLHSDYYLKEYDFQTPIKLVDIPIDSQAALNSLYDEKPIYVEVTDFEYNLPNIQRGFKLSQVLEKLTSNNSQVIIKKDNTSSSQFIAQKISVSELLDYWKYDLPQSHTDQSQDEQLDSESHIEFVDEDRLDKAKTYRSKRTVKNLIRYNGVVDSRYSQQQTDFDEYLIYTNLRNRHFVTKNHRFYISNFIIDYCDANIVVHESTNIQGITQKLLTSLIQFDQPETIAKIDPHLWRVESTKQLLWKLSNFNHQTLTGDINKTCLNYRAAINPYFPILAIPSEEYFLFQIVGIKRVAEE